LIDRSASMQFGTADRRKADVAEGVALALGHVASRRGNRLGVITSGAGAAAQRFSISEAGALPSFYVTADTPASVQAAAEAR
jgi:uncharacterized protein (DUF58 family)